jgi:hypothetical protein
MSKFGYLYADPTVAQFSSSSAAKLNSPPTGSGPTPFGTYDTDISFASESINVCKWTARRLGHPVMQLEFNSGSIWACFEEATSEYSLHINNYNMKNWLWESYGSDNKISGSGWSNTGTASVTMGTGSIQPTHGGLGTSFFMSKKYGEMVNIGGETTMYTGSIVLTGSKQSYDLQSESVISASHSGKRLEIQKVFNQGPSAITRFYDPYAGSFDQRQMLDNFGMGNVSPAVSFILRPISYDITRAQAIETSDLVRKSAYSFELINNNLRIFPRPSSGDAGDKIYFHYYLRDDQTSTTRSTTTNKVTDPSNVPYKFITYNEINASGRQWIRKYTLALSKELLGIIRSKYASLPVPGGEVTMDGESLKAEGIVEKTELLTELKEFLESVSLTEKSKAEQEQAEANSSVLSRAPLGIYIG